MDDATRLIADLEEKLADLDHKVATYRQGLADEFTRHEQRLLRDVPETLCATVKGSVARSLSKYPAISPALARADSPEPCSGAATPAADANTTGAVAAAASTATAPANTSAPGTGATDAAASTAAPATAASRPADHEDSSPAAPRLPRPATPPPSLQPPPPPSPPAATDDLGHMSDSPEDREAELRGLFTPTFLPLLDISVNRMRSPPTPPKPRSSPRNCNPPMAAAAAAATTTKMDAADPARPGPGEARPSSSPPTCTQLPTRPPAIRRATDDQSTSSLLSDKSDSKSRRSALRRSSSSSKPQSPRRVRFEVAGTEVLPTSSPSNSSQDLRQPPSDGGYTAPALDEDDPTRPRSVAAILGLNDAEEDEPPPKKVSSSQALRALSRLPLDSDTVWIPVTQDSTPGPNSEGRGADGVKPNSPLKSETPAANSPGVELRPAPAPASPPRRPAALEVGRAKTHPGAPLPRSTDSWDDEDSDESSDDDFLSMAKPKSFRNKKSLVSSRPRSLSGDEESRPVPARRATTGTVSNTAKAPRAPTPPPGVLRGGARQSRAAAPSAANQTRDEAPDVGPDYSDVFDFEESEGMPARPPTPPREESDSELEDMPPRQSREPLHMYSTSPAVSIPARHAVQRSPRAGEALGATPTNIPSTTPKSQVPAVGSYRGRSITMPVVVNPSIHEQAAAMGEFNSFVGSLDGRTGMDDGDVSSFRASIAAVDFGGTPRSLTQRMMLEEREEIMKKG